MWFEELTGFAETDAAALRQNIYQDGEYLVCKTNGKKFKAGRLSMPSLGELKAQAFAVLQSTAKQGAPLSLQEIVADAQALHIEPANAGALFQVASQFNLLEMVSPEVTPERGVTNYQFDRTQGPACAIACAAGLIYRNYFVPVKDELGQSEHCQLDMLEEFGLKLAALINDKFDSLNAAMSAPWLMRNGYALPSRQQLMVINTVLQTLTANEREQLKNTIKIGIQHNTQVTLANCSHTVTQAYCSAMPVAYSQQRADLWQPLAKLILEAAYEATLAAAAINANETANKTVFLTLIGGGAFGNALAWIKEAIFGALQPYRHSGLAIKIVSYSSSSQIVQQLIAEYSANSEA